MKKNSGNKEKTKANKFFRRQLPALNLRNVLNIVIALLLMFSLYTSFGESLKILVAAFAATPVPLTSENLSRVEVLNLRRKIQRHFSDAGVYIPMEDIRVNSLDLEFDLVTLEKRKRYAIEAEELECGKNARLMVWLPLFMDLPFVGRISYYWCWTPRTYLSKS